MVLIRAMVYNISHSVKDPYFVQLVFASLNRTKSRTIARYTSRYLYTIVYRSNSLRKWTRNEIKRGKEKAIKRVFEINYAVVDQCTLVKTASNIDTYNTPFRHNHDTQNGFGHSSWGDLHLLLLLTDVQATLILYNEQTERERTYLMDKIIRNV